MTFNNVEHIFFDLDHTLWDFDKNSALTFEIIFKEEKVEIDLADFLKAYMPINENYWKLYRENRISKEALRTGRLEDCFKYLKLSVSPLIIESLSNKYIKFLPNYNHLLEDTIDVLEYLYPKYKLHIITNGFEEVQNLKLTNSNISKYFDSVTTSEEAGVKKPHALIFQKALEKCHAPAENSLMVGDNLEADIMGAKNAGMHSIFFDYYQKEGNTTNTLSIQKLKDLMLYL
jgi:putative hydrolase of the HAD superfamily